MNGLALALVVVVIVNMVVHVVMSAVRGVKSVDIQENDGLDIGFLLMVQSLINLNEGETENEEIL